MRIRGVSSGTNGTKCFTLTQSYQTSTTFKLFQSSDPKAMKIKKQGQYLKAFATEDNEAGTRAKKGDKIGTLSLTTEKFWGASAAAKHLYEALGAIKIKRPQHKIRIDGEGSTEEIIQALQALIETLKHETKKPCFSFK